MTVTPRSVSAGSKGNTLTFTYTAAPGGLSGGGLEVIVPSGWSAPSTSSGAAGYVTSRCGTVSVSGRTLKASRVTLASGKTCLIVYGSRAGSGPGASAPPATGTDTFTASEQSTSTGTATTLATSPAVKVK
jgi:hypothetical protein